MKKCYTPIALTVLCAIISFSSFATHMRGGQILLRKIAADANDRRYEIRIQAYIDTESTVPFGGASSDILAVYGRSHQAFTINVPEITANSGDGRQTFQVIDAARHIAFVEYVYPYTFPGNDVYTISYTEVNRNAGVLNFNRSVDTPFYIETKFTLDSSFQPASGTPVYLEAPIFYGFAGEPFNCSVGGYSPDSASLYYRLVTPKSSLMSIVQNYARPTGMSINPLTGLITWDGMFQGMPMPGEYGFAVEITTIKDGVITNKTIRDFQIILEDNAMSNVTMSTAATLGEYNQIYLPEEKDIRVFFEYSDDANYEIAVSRASEIVDKISFETYDSTAAGKKVKVALIHVDPSSLTNREVPYLINFRARLSKNASINEQDFSILILTQDVELSVPEEPASVNDEQHLLKAFPNPVHDYLTLEENILQKTEVMILSSDGKRQIFPIEQDRRRIDFRSAPSGIYLIKIKGQSKSQTIKIFKD